MKNIAVYTVIFGGYDDINPVKKAYKDEADFYLFTDRPIKAKDYRIIQVEPDNENLRRASRLYKINPHLFFPDYKYTIYIDGSIEMLISPKKAVNKYLKGSDVAVHKHPYRDCIYDERSL